MTVALGATLPQFTGEAMAFKDAIRRAEDAGLDSVWVFDHLWPLSGGKERPVLECWSALAWAAAATERIRLGTLVTRSSMRNPVLVARMADTLGSIAPGRIVVGVGSGDDLSRAENEAFGLPFPEGEERAQQLEEAVVVIKETLAGSHAPPPVSTIPVPVWVAGRSDAALALAARHGDGWNGWSGTPGEFGTLVHRLRSEAGDRDVLATWAGLCILGADDDEARRRLGRRDPQRYLWGGPEKVAAGLRDYVEAGAQEVILVSPHAGEPGYLERLGGAVRGAI